MVEDFLPACTHCMQAEQSLEEFGPEDSGVCPLHLAIYLLCTSQVIWHANSWKISRLHIRPREHRFAGIPPRGRPCRTTEEIFTEFTRQYPNYTRFNSWNSDKS